MSQIIDHISLNTELFPSLIYKHSSVTTVASYWIKLCSSLRSKKTDVQLKQCDVLFIGQTSHLNKYNKEIFVEHIKKQYNDDILVVIPNLKKQSKHVFPLENLYTDDMIRKELKFFSLFSRVGQKYLPELVRYILLYEKLIQETKPRIIFVTGWINMLSLSILCHMYYKDIKVAYYQEGIMNKHSSFLKNYLVDSLCFPDMYCVHGSLEQSYLQSYGIPKQMIYSIGNIRLIDTKQKKQVTWFTQTHGISPQETKVSCNILFKYFYKERDHFMFNIRLHANEDQHNTIYHAYNQRYNNVANIYSGDTSVIDMLHQTDVVITKFSSAGFESVYLSKLLVILDFMNDNDSEYLDYNFPCVKRDFDLFPFLKPGFQEQYQNICKQYLDQKKGDTTIGEVIKNVIQ